MDRVGPFERGSIYPFRFYCILFSSFLDILRTKCERISCSFVVLSGSVEQLTRGSGLVAKVLDWSVRHVCALLLTPLDTLPRSAV